MKGNSHAGRVAPFLSVICHKPSIMAFIWAPEELRDNMEL